MSSGPARAGNPHGPGPLGPGAGSPISRTRVWVTPPTTWARLPQWLFEPLGHLICGPTRPTSPTRDENGRVHAPLLDMSNRKFSIREWKNSYSYRKFLLDMSNRGHGHVHSHPYLYINTKNLIISPCFHSFHFGQTLAVNSNNLETNAYFK